MPEKNKYFVTSLEQAVTPAVHCCNKLSDFFTCNAGGRQGENLSPLLFSIYLNDFESYVSRHYQGLSVISNKTVNNVSIDDAEVYLRLFVLL